MSKLRTIILVLALLILLLGLAGLIHATGPNQPPVAFFTYSPDNPTPQESILFDASGSYAPSGRIVQYAWDFGDGVVSTLTDPLITHSYPVDGDYTVQLTVTDDNGYVGTAIAVVPIRCVVFLRVVIMGQPGTPVGGVKVTAYYKSGSAWVKIPASDHGVEIKYDNMTQPNLASTPAQKYRNPGYTATILRKSASNIGFDFHSSDQEVFFKIEWGSYIAYWPNETTRVYSYKSNGIVETHDYNIGHQAHWDPSAQTYVIKTSHIPDDGVSPTEGHPIIVGINCPPPTSTYYLTVNTSPPGITTIPGQGSYIANTNVTLTAPTYVNVSTSTRYRFDYWDVDGASRGSGVNPITIFMNANHTATAHYITQYSATFNQTGLSSDATGTIATVNGAPQTLAQFPYVLWVDNGGSVTYSYNSVVSSSISGKQYRRASVSGPTSPITITGPATVTGNYVTQYLITFNQAGLDSTAAGTVVNANGTAKAFTDLPYSLWVDTGGTVTYSYSSLVASSVSGKQFRLNTVSGPASPITISGPATVTGNFVIQYQVTFTQTGLDSSATGAVVTVSGNPKVFTDLPFAVWTDSGSSITYSYSDVASSTVGKRFILTGVTGSPSPITVTGTMTIRGNYKTQYRVTFDQSGVGADFTGTVLTVDSTNYGIAGLPTQFWWDQSSSHNFAFASPLTVNSSKQYSWSSTSGLSSLQTGTLTITTSGNVIGNYIVQNCVTFDQLGVNPDFSGTVVVIDGTSYGRSSLPISFYWQLGSTHNFAFQSPLVVTLNEKQYVWTSTAGLSSAQSGSMTVAVFGSIVANYKTQYYLILATSPLSVTSPSGAGWYDANTYATISTTPYIDMIPGSSRYRFNDWTTPDMTELTNSSAPNTTVFLDKAKTVTANYVTQYAVTMAQTGLGSDFTGTILTVDSTGYTYSTLPVSFWWDSSSSHAFSFSSPLPVNISKQYNWVSTTGLATVQNGVLNVAGSGNVIGNYAVENKYCVTFDQVGVSSDYSGTVVIVDGTGYAVLQLPVSFWVDVNSLHTFAYQSPLTVSPNGKQYVWTSTTGLSNSQSDSITVASSGSVVGNYKTQYYLSLATNPLGITTPSGAGWYDAGTNASISTVAFVDIVPGTSRYRFNGWTTANMAEIADPNRSPTTVLMDEGKTVTANYAVQYKITLGQAGVNTDFTGIIVTIDGLDFNGSVLPASFMWDKDSIHTFSYYSPLIVNPTKQYVWAYTSGLSTLQTDSITISAPGSVTGNYVEKLTYTLTIAATTGGITNPAIGPHIYQGGTTVQVTAIPDPGFQLDRWELDSSNVGPANPYSVFVNQDHTLKAVFKPVSSVFSVIINPMSGSIHVGESLTFNSIVNGGVPPYSSYQWYLDSMPVQGATSSSWTYTPQHASTHFVYLKVTDSNGTTIQSNTAVINVSSTPIGGYSISFANPSPLSNIVAYVAIIALSSAILSSKKRKRK
jgi:hypothetical protein